MADASEVQAALEEVLTNNAESQTADTSQTEVADAVKTALNPQGEKADSASDNRTDKGAEDTDKESKMVPYERLSQVVKQKNEFSEQLKVLEEKFKAVTARETELRTRIGTLEQDGQILDAIKNLAQDERYRDHVVAIDKALQGIDEDREVAEEKGDQKAVSEAEKRFAEKAAELDNLLADRHAEDLWNETAGHARNMLEALPEAYIDADKDLIGKLWVRHVDWSAIEEKGSEVIPDVLNKSFAAVIKEYGTPRGAIVANTTKEIESRIPEARATSDEEVVKGLIDKDWAERDKDGNLVCSEDDFVDGLAELYRRTRGA